MLFFKVFRFSPNLIICQQTRKSEDMSKGSYDKYVGGGVGEGGRSVFVWVMKYFRHILMGHEIFFKIFDGPQNIFLCSIFVILFFKLKRMQHSWGIDAF